VILDTLVGRIEAVEARDNDKLLSLISDKRETLESVLNGIELVGGTETENRVFNVDEEIVHFNRFGKIVYVVDVTRSEFIQYLNYEVFNFLNYKSINEMRRMRSG